MKCPQCGKELVQYDVPEDREIARLVEMASASLDGGNTALQPDVIDDIKFSTDKEFYDYIKSSIDSVALGNLLFCKLQLICKSRYGVDINTNDLLFINERLFHHAWE